MARLDALAAQAITREVATVRDALAELDATLDDPGPDPRDVLAQLDEAHRRVKAARRLARRALPPSTVRRW